MFPCNGLEMFGVDPSHEHGCGDEDLLWAQIVECFVFGVCVDLGNLFQDNLFAEKCNFGVDWKYLLDWH